jgi:hypothetical protein
MPLFTYRSDNTKYPDPKNFFEWIALKIRNLFDEEYKQSKANYQRLHRFDAPGTTRTVRFNQKENAKMIRQIRKSRK